MGKEYVGNELALLKQPDIAARSAAHCASACTRHQGRVRCSAWTFSHMPRSSAGSCTLRSSSGSEAVNSSSAVSGYIQGGSQSSTSARMLMPYRLPEGAEVTTQQYGREQHHPACCIILLQNTLWFVGAYPSTAQSFCWHVMSIDSGCMQAPILTSCSKGLLMCTVTSQMVYSTRTQQAPVQQHAGSTRALPPVLVGRTAAPPTPHPAPAG